MAAAMAAECVVLVVVRTVVVVCVVVCEQHLVCELGGQVSEARVVRTFLANDAAYLTLLGAVTQLRRSEIVTLGVGLPVVVLCGVFNESWVSADCPFLRIKTQHITPRGQNDRRARTRSAIFAVARARGCMHVPGYTDRQQVADVENRFFANFGGD